jgi:phage host-nuclease inhibitor protein Gam
MNTEHIQRAKQQRLALFLKNPAELLAALQRGAGLTIKIQAKTAKLNAKLKEIKDEFATDLDALSEELKEVDQSVMQYAELNRETLFGEAQSVKVGGHGLKYRDNGGAVKTVKKVTQEGALDRLLLCEGDEETLAAEFVTWKASLNKARIKALYEEHEEFLRSKGLIIEHEETLSIEYDLEEPTAAAKNVA